MSAHNVYYVKYDIRARNPPIAPTLPHEIHKHHLVIQRLLTRLDMAPSITCRSHSGDSDADRERRIRKPPGGPAMAFWHKLLQHACGALDRRWVL